MARHYAEMADRSRRTKATIAKLRPLKHAPKKAKGDGLLLKR
ncbi:MAG: hypothetical protein ACLPKH_14280 [Rhodomicrobium sp.]